jgi:hypothetical protein
MTTNLADCGIGIRVFTYLSQYWVLWHEPAVIHNGGVTAKFRYFPLFADWRRHLWSDHVPMWDTRRLSFEIVLQAKCVPANADSPNTHTSRSDQQANRKPAHDAILREGVNLFSPDVFHPQKKTGLTV